MQIIRLRLQQKIDETMQVYLLYFSFLQYLIHKLINVKLISLDSALQPVTSDRSSRFAQLNTFSYLITESK